MDVVGNFVLRISVVVKFVLRISVAAKMSLMVVSLSILKGSSVDIDDDEDIVVAFAID